ncbi:MAG: sulfotransferase family 2 domain-containing protein [Planctomycetota bacterium]
MNPHFEVSRSHKIAYMLLKKCGCTSIVASLKSIEASDFDPQEYRKLHDSLELVPANELIDTDDWFVFTIVRDPIRRFLSFYSDKILSGSLNVNKIVRDTASRGYSANMCLDDAIEVAVSERFVADPHVVPQSRQIDSAEIEFDFIGRFETFNESLQIVARKNDVQIEPLHLNRKLFSPVLLNQEQFEALADYYREDQTRFGYPREYEQWRKANLDFAGTEFQAGTGFQVEQGFVFEEEARLLRHKVVRRPDHVELQLDWRLLETQARWRLIRLVEVDAAGQRSLIKRYQPLREIGDLADSDGFVQERIKISLSEIPQDVDPGDVGIEISFFSAEKKKTVIRDFSESGRLLLPIPPEPVVQPR